MNENKNKFTELSELGRDGLVKKLTSNNTLKNSSTIKGAGDDAAVISYGNDEKIVISTNLLVEGIDFNFAYSPLRYVGYKAITTSISEIYAMNAKPEQVTVSFAVSSKFSYEAMNEIYEGIGEACQTYGVDLIGGDTSSSKIGMFMSITAVGRAKADQIVYRDTARPDDLLCVSGDLGAAFLGWHILERERKIAEETKTQPEWGEHNYLLARQIKPEARQDIFEFLRSSSILPTAMTNVSQGLATEILQLCRNSHTGALIYEDNLPTSEQTIKTAEEMHISPTTAAMNGGEDYELLFTINQEHYTKINENYQISIIGRIVPEEENVKMLTLDNKKIIISEPEWNKQN